MNKRKWILIACLFLVWDRIEFLYYAFEGMDNKVGFIFMGDPIRIDSYVYFASIYAQTVIMAVIIHLIIGLKESRYFVYACGLCLIEYFFTYGQAIAKIPLPFDLYVPVSCSTVRLASVCYLMYGCIRKALNQ